MRHFLPTLERLNCPLGYVRAPRKLDLRPSQPPASGPALLGCHWTRTERILLALRDLFLFTANLRVIRRFAELAHERSSMATLETVNATHTSHATLGIAIAPEEATEHCPWCQQPITRSEYNRIRGEIEAQETARIAKLENGLRDKFTREQGEAEKKSKAAIELARKDAAKAAEAVLKQRLETERQTFATKMGEAVAAEKARAYQERMQLDAQLQDLQRKLQRKTAGELGNEFEIDLLTELRAAFAADKISRVGKGVAGPDIVQEIIHKDTTCGTIIYDCKNHRRWLNRFTVKLRQDQLSAQADHAVLVTAVFPAGLQQLAMKDGVIIAAPPRVIALAHLLRRQSIQSYGLRLSSDARAEKTERLYKFMTSPGAGPLWDRIAQVTSDMIDLDRAETAAHQKTWTRRADLIRAVQGVHDEFSAAIDRIIGGTEASL